MMGAGHSVAKKRPANRISRLLRRATPKERKRPGGGRTRKEVFFSARGPWNSFVKTGHVGFRRSEIDRN